MSYVNEGFSKKILAALKWLRQHNTLYANININHEWEERCASNELWQFLTWNSATQDNTDHSSSNTEQMTHKTTSLATETTDEVYLWELADGQAAVDCNAEISTQPYSSCLQLDDIEGGTFCIAPAKDQKPKYILTDNDFEVLLFPDLFPTGDGRYYRHEPQERKLDMQWYYNQWLWDCDVQFASNIEYLFWSQYTTELRQIQGSTGIALQLKHGKTLHRQWLAVGMLCSSYVFQNLVHSDQAYKFLQTVHGTPAYWQKMLFESLAMLKALGTQTFFMTVSATDYHCPETIQAICRCFTDEDALNMS